MFANLKRIAPRRGWRAFAGEVGIIVLGVLIAVGIGKVVEALDWRDKVSGARSALERDVQDGVFYLTERVVTAPCLQRQMNRLEARLLGSVRVAQQRVKGTNGTIFESVYMHPSRGWSVLQWTSTVADNIPAHLPTADRDFYRDHYLQLAKLNVLNGDEDRETADLDLLSLPVTLDVRTRDDLLRTIARERQRINLMNIISRYVLNNIKSSGRNSAIRSSDQAEMNTLNWCRAKGLA